MECLQVLEEYNLDINGGAKGSLFHYEQREHDFKQGEVLRNFNGTDYKVMERYSANNFLMMNMVSGRTVLGMPLMRRWNGTSRRRLCWMQTTIRKPCIFW